MFNLFNLHTCTIIRLKESESDEFPVDCDAQKCLSFDCGADRHTIFFLFQTQWSSQHLKCFLISYNMNICLTSEYFFFHFEQKPSTTTNQDQDFYFKKIFKQQV